MYKILLQNRNFRWLWLAQILFTLGGELFNLGATVTIFEQTGSTLQTMGVMISWLLPSFLLSPFAGVLVDRYPRQRVMAWMAGLQTILAGCVFLFYDGNVIHLVGAYGILVGMAVARTFYRPALLALVPSIVMKGQLVRANSLMMSTNQITAATAYAIGGGLILWLGLPTIVWLNIVSYILVVVLVWSLVVPKREENDQDAGTSFWQSALDGFRYARDHHVARPLIVMETLEHIPHGIWTGAILLVFTERALQAGSEAWGFQISGWYAGQILGAVIAVGAASWLARYPGWTIIGNAFSSGVLTFVYANSPSVVFAVALAFVFGMPFALRDVAQDSLLQATVKQEILGRVYATREMLRNVMFLSAGIFFGWLADRIPIQDVYMLGGGLYLVTAVYALLSAGIRQSRLTSI